MRHRFLLYCSSKNAGLRGISGPCLKVLRFFVKHRCASTGCLFFDETMRHRFVAHFRSSRAACYSVLRNASQRGTFLIIRQSLFPAHLFLGAPVLSKVFSRNEASSDKVVICHAGQHFQTCRPTENLSFCPGEGSPKHTWGQRHHRAIL